MTRKMTRRAAKKAGQGESTFIRNAAVEKAQRNMWGKSQFGRDELEGQYIEFQLHSEKGVTEGIGRIAAGENDKGQICVDIFIDVLAQNGAITGYRVWIDGQGVEKIELNPDQLKAKFRLLA